MRNACGSTAYECHPYHHTHAMITLQGSMLPGMRSRAPVATSIRTKRAGMSHHQNEKKTQALS
jgi:hypothetical protein